MISILMATYNGESYLAQQIDSLLEQSNQEFLLYINDDCSTDNTMKIVYDYAAKHSDKIFVSQNIANTGNAKHNFISMMAAYKNDYIMLCDQDDVWLPNKVEITLAKMKELECQHSAKVPLLVHTDLTVVDQDLNIINPSYREATSRKYGRTSMNQVLTLNNASGCTLMYNRAMADLLVKKPSFCEVHDWWLQIVAAYLGKIGHIDEQTVLYRQHGDNSIGAKDTRTLTYKIKQFCNNSHIKNRINATYPQARSLLELYRNSLSDRQIELLESFISIPSMGKISRWRTIWKKKLFMDGFSRNIAYFMFV